MDFQSVNGKEISLDVNKNHSEKNVKNIQSVESSTQDDLTKLPNDPAYWQNSVGIKSKISFKGCNADSIIESKVQELIQRGLSENYALAVAETCINPQSGEFSPIAENLLDFFYPFQTENGIKGKIKYLKSNLKNKRITKSKVDIVVDCDPLKILDSVKNSSGEFDKKNLTFLYKVIKTIGDNYSFCSLPFTDVSHILDMLKNKDGVVDDDKFARFASLYKSHEDGEIESILKVLDLFPQNKRDKIYSICSRLIQDNEVLFDNFSGLAHYCFDKDGNSLDENINDAQKIITFNKSLVFKDEFFDIYGNFPELRSFIMNIITNIDNQTSLDMLVSFLSNQIKLCGTVSDFAKNKLLEYLASGNNLDDFQYIYNSCCMEKSGVNNDFDDDLFQKVVELRNIIRITGANKSSKNGKDYLSLISGDIKPYEISFNNKVNLLNDLTKISSYISKNNIDGFKNLSTVILTLESSLKMENISLPVDKKFIAEFNKEILHSRDSYTKFENVMVSSIPMLEKLAKKDGLPLLYSRKAFLEDLSSICKSDEDIDLLIQKTGITPILDDNESDRKIIGYNGLIQLKELNLDNPKEKQIYSIMHKFMYANKVITGNDSFDEQINIILKACPEFINTIGKKQHRTHNYTLDVHSLLLLAYSINNPAYLTKLNSLDKTLLKISAIFHDIMKQENTVDKGHQNLSSLYARSIISKIFTSAETKDRVFGLIDNHHWLQEYSESRDRKETAKKLAFQFRMPNDFEIAKIMADSDLKAVSPSFYDHHKEMLDPGKLDLIQKNIDYMYSNGNAIFSDYIIKPSCLDDNIQFKDGKEYCVINLHELSNTCDMGKYGFMSGVNKEDLVFLVHMVDENSIYDSLSTVKMLTSPFNGGVLSESIITPENKRTYQNRKYGVLLSQENMNLVNESNSNQGSGVKKSFSNVISLIFDDNLKAKRNNFKSELFKNLEISEGDVSAEDYAEFFKNVLAYKRSLKQINPNKSYKLGNFNITGEQLILALNKYQRDLIHEKEETHNEIVGYLPKIQAVIAKVQNLDEVPDDLLKFANENNYPIILI